MSDTFIYVLTNETTGMVSKHESLNAALDAVNDEIAHREEWVIDLTGGKKSGPAKSDAPKAE